MTKYKKIIISIIIVLAIILLVSYLSYMIYPNNKNVLNEAYVTCGAINLLSSEGYMTQDMIRTNYTPLTQKTLKTTIRVYFVKKDLIFKENPFNISVDVEDDPKSLSLVPSSVSDNILKCRNNRFYTERNFEKEKEYNNIPSDSKVKVWVGFEKPIPFSEYEKAVYYKDNNTILLCSTAFKSSDNLDAAAIHLRSSCPTQDCQGYFKDELFYKSNPNWHDCGYPLIQGEPMPIEALSYYINLCKKDTKYLEKLLNSELFNDVNLDFEKAYQYIKNNNYDVAGYSIIGTKDKVDEKLKALPNSFIVDFNKEY